MAPNNIENLESLLQTWVPIAKETPETPPNQPVTILVGEAQHIAHVAQVHWEPLGTLPGLKGGLVNGLIQPTVITETLDIATCLSRVHARFRAIEHQELVAPVEQGEVLLFEIKRSLEFLFDDDVNDERDAELARLSESHTDTTSHDALALSLEGFAYYAHDFRDQLATLPEFDPGYIDEALEVAHRLRAQSALKVSSKAKSLQKDQLTLRNQLVTLLSERVHKLRRAARYVFRNHPEVSREFGSDYERRQRARQRAARKALAQNGATQEVSA